MQPTPPPTADTPARIRPLDAPSPQSLRICREAQRKSMRQWALIVFGILAAFLGPQLLINKTVTGGYTQTFWAVMVDIAIFSIAALGLNILVGYTGLLNLGFAGFMCIGAYTAAILMREYHWNYFPACLAAVLHGALWGIILGLPTLHLTGDYFAIVTFGFAELVILAAKNNIFGLTNGTRGYPEVPSASFLGWQTQITEKRFDWYFACFWLVVVVIFVARASKSRLGRAWRAIHADELAAESCGINTRWYKTLAFALAAGLGGLAGAIQAVNLHNVAYTNFTFIYSVYVLVYIVLGGMGTISGAIIGTGLMVSLLELLRWFLKEVLPSPGWFPALKGWMFLEDLRLLLYGALLVILVRYRPEGLVPSSRVTRELHPGDLQRWHADVGYDDVHSEREKPEPGV